MVTHGRKIMIEWCLQTSGKMIRVSIDSISKTGKNTQGVKIVKLDDGDKVVSLAKTPSEKDDGVFFDEE